MQLIFNKRQDGDYRWKAVRIHIMDLIRRRQSIGEFQNVFQKYQHKDGSTTTHYIYYEQLPMDYVYDAILYDPEKQEYLILFYHPSFPIVPKGVTPPFVETDWEIISIYTQPAKWDALKAHGQQVNDSRQWQSRLCH